MNWINKVFRLGGYLLFLMISVAALLEITFRILPTSDSLRVKPVNIDNPILRFEENRDVRKQIGFDFTHINVKHINNNGFATDRDFQAKAAKEKPIIAVIGDSYVDALQVKNSDTFHAKVDSKFQEMHVYPIGMSGSPLSQYLAYAKYAKSQFDPDFYVFLIISNDFDESWYAVKKSPGFHYFNQQGALELLDYRPSAIKKLARKSAFLRYLHLDLKIKAQLSRILNSQSVSIENKPVIDNAILEKGTTAIDFFLEGIGQFTLDKKVILMLDGDRKSIYEGMVERSLDRIENRWYVDLIKKSKEVPNLHLVDLHSDFQYDWSLNNKSFNYDYDSHWNERGHAIAANALSAAIEQLNE